MKELRRILLIAVLLVVISCRAYEAPIIVLNIPPPTVGMTRCSVNNLPVIIVSPLFAGTAEGMEIVEHERIHVRQMLGHKGGCWGAFNHAVADKNFRVSQEVEAYCFNARKLVRPIRMAHIHELFRVAYDTSGVKCPQDVAPIISTANWGPGSSIIQYSPR